MLILVKLLFGSESESPGPYFKSEQLLFITHRLALHVLSRLLRSSLIFIILLLTLTIFVVSRYKFTPVRPDVYLKSSRILLF